MLINDADEHPAFIVHKNLSKNKNWLFSGEKYLQESLNELEVAMSNPEYRKSDCNHIFLNFVPCMVIHPMIVKEKVTENTAVGHETKRALLSLMHLAET